MVQKKVFAAIEEGLIPVVCIGETERDQGKEILHNQINIILRDIEKTSSLIVVYEPEWAISSNAGAEPATPERVKESVAYMKEVLSGMFSEHAVPILYGGSVDASNIQSFLREADVQGALVGSASLDAREFIELVKNSR
jgi:triosephosphate isomerase